MRILHFAQNVAGGISSYFDEIAEHQLAQYGHDNVVFLMPGRDVRNLTHVPHHCVHTFDHVERTVPSLIRLGVLVARFTNRFRPDIVHLHSTFAGMIFRLAMPFLRLKPKVIYCPHGWAFAREQSTAATRTFAILETQMMRLTDVCINISANEARVATAHGVPLDRCVTIPNGISPRRLSETPLRGGDADGVRLLFVGRHDPQKGIDILLDAMRLVTKPSIHLTVAGASVVSNSKDAPLEAPPNVTMLGHVARATVDQLMLDCDAVVVPSRWEGFGLVVLEAMRAGRATIVSANGALPDLVTPGETGFIIPDLTPDGLAALLDTLDRSTLLRMGRAAKAEFHAHHTSDRMNAAIDAVYLKVLQD